VSFENSSHQFHKITLWPVKSCAAEKS